MTILHAAVKEANDRGALALMIYAIPNFPDPDDTSQKSQRDRNRNRNSHA